MSGWPTISGLLVFPPTLGEGASECNGAPGAASGAGCWGPHSAMEAMNRSGRPRNSGGGNAARSLDKWRSSSGGNHLWGVGPHLRYSFLIKLASLSGLHPRTFACNPYNNTPVIATGQQTESRVRMHQTGLLFSISHSVCVHLRQFLRKLDCACLVEESLLR